MPAWEATELLTIGVEAGAPPFEFGRIANAVKLADGRIAVGDGQNLEVRLFTPDGRYHRSFGRRGTGPAEFNVLSLLSRTAGDTLIAGSNSRLARYTADGMYTSEQRFVWTEFDRPPHFVEYAWPLANGLFVLTLLRTSAGEPPVMSLHRSTKMYLLAGSDGSLIDSLGVFAALEQLRYREGSETYSALPLFPADTRMRSAPDYVVVGDMNSDSVLLYTISMRTRKWITLPLDRKAIPAETLSKARATACQWASSAETRARCETDLRQLPPQAEFPVFQDLAVDSLGAIWVGTYSPDRTDSTRWLVIDSTGQPVGASILPSNLRLKQIGSTYLLGVARDTMGVERVQEFSVSRR